MNLTDEDVREILRLLDESPYAELKLETDRFSLTLKSDGAAEVDEAPRAMPAAAVDTDSTPAAGDAAREGPVATTHARADAAGEIRAVYPPLPGTFYRAPSPGAKPFVDTGSAVQEDTILGLVETMKLMNSVMADCRGEVLEICAENGALVEVGDVLMRIRVETT